MLPFDLGSMEGTFGYALIFFAIGVGFGAVLEMAGFGDSRKLSAQFYLTDLTVLKVMFTGIIVAMALIFASSALGLTDFSRIFVNPTYLGPGIVGGLIMGVGFIVGGFCPGTSLVSASTFKLDGIAFVLGTLFGAFAFGESVGFFEDFYHAGFLGRFTLDQWLGIPTGFVVVGVILMALMMFFLGEVAEDFFGKKIPWAQISLRPKHLGKMLAASSLLGLGVVVLLVGQPTLEARIDRLAPKLELALGTREVFVDPREVVELKKDFSLRVEVLDLRDEEAFNQFHLTGAKRATLSELRDAAWVAGQSSASDNTIRVLLAENEAQAVEGYKLLLAQGVINLYILEGGLNHWLELYPAPGCVAEYGAKMGWNFRYALGDRLAAAHPDFVRRDPVPPCWTLGVTPEAWFQQELHKQSPTRWEKKVKLQKKGVAKGGCG